MFEVTTLGQPLEVMKTTMAANRKDGMVAATQRIWGRGGVLGCKFTTSAWRRGAVWQCANMIVS